MLTKQSKKLVIISCIVLGILGVFYGSVYLLSKIYLNPLKVKELIISQAEKRLQRTVSMSDDLDLSIGWNMAPLITIHDLTISNVSWAQHPQMLVVKDLSISFDLIKLLFKQLRVISLNLNNCKLNLESNNKNNNWTFDEKNIEPMDKNTSNIKPSINHIAITNSVITYNTDKLSIDKLDFATDIDQTKFHAHFVGKHDNLPIKTSFDVDRSDKEMNINITNLQAGMSDLHGKLKIKESPLYVKGEINADNLDLKDFQYYRDSNKNSDEYTISKDLLPIIVLDNSDIDVNIKMNSLTMGKLTLQNIKFNINNKNNILNLKLDPPANIADGKMNLNITLDHSKNTPALFLLAKTNGLHLEQLCYSLFGKSPIKGSKLDINIDLTGSGNNLYAIVNSLDGQILIKAGPGDFLNSNDGLTNVFTSILNGVISFDKKTSSTSFTCAVINLNVINGIAKATNGIGIEAASVNVLGSGTLDLRNGRINFSINPQNILSGKIDLSSFSMAQLMKITGTITNPKISLDPTSLLSAGESIATELATKLPGMGLPTGLTSIITSQVLNTTKTSTAVSPCKKALGEQ